MESTRPDGGSIMERRRITSNFTSRLARWSATHRKRAIWGWLGLVFALVALIMGGKVVEQKDISTVDSFSGQSQQAERALTDAGLRPNEEVAFIHSDESVATAPEFEATVDRVAAELEATKYVSNVVTPADGGGAVSDDGHAVLVDFQIAGSDLEAQDNVVPSQKAIATLDRESPRFRVEQVGSASIDKELESIFGSDLGKAGSISLPLTMLILAVALGGLVAAGVPLLLALTGVMATMALVAIPSQLFPLDSNVGALVLLIGLAVGVDYSLFYMRREREERARGLSPQESLQAAAATSGRAVLISGLTVMIAMAGMFITGESTFESFAVATVTVVAVEMFVSLVVLPAVLAWLGDRVEKGRIPLTRGMRRKAGESRMWSGIVRRVMRRPAASAALATGVLLALAIPALGMTTTQSGPDDLPPDLPIMKKYDRFTDAFPDKENVNEVVVKAGDVRGGEVAAAIDALVEKAGESQTFIGPAEVTYSDDGTVAQIGLPSRGNGTDGTSIAALDEVREELVPATVGAVDGAEASVTGGAASTKDFNQVLEERMPLVFAFVLGLAFVLMLITFRSLVIPIKAIALNLLSVGAAYGVLVLVFQNGWGESLLGFESNGGVTNWLPVFLFVILFGLSMDYHVFILTRVRELYDRGLSTEDAVREGISRTAGTVTSAAAVMVGVFSVFATLSFIDFKEMGVGLAVAILIDATIIRGVLLPAAMKLLGDWNWYLPRWLDRALPGSGRRGGTERHMPAGSPEASPEPARA
ncbi:MAG: MMPL family transporter [Solirubrobacterales bacterium]